MGKKIFESYLSIGNTTLSLVIHDNHQNAKYCAGCWRHRMSKVFSCPSVKPQTVLSSHAIELGNNCDKEAQKLGMLRQKQVPCPGAKEGLPEKGGCHLRNGEQLAK